MTVTRRGFLAGSVALPLLGAPTPAKKLKVVVTGGHPGDPECGCAGTIARYTDLGHEVALLYLNRGEGFCTGAPASQCGTVRTAEAKKACEILKARAIFAGQIDGQGVVDNRRYDDLARILESENPDIVFAQWPIDEHRDHRALSMLVLDACLKSAKKPALYYYEVADDTLMFAPTEFVDISDPAVESRRRAACYAHASQEPEKWYRRQVEITRYRGAQSGHGHAEAFVRLWRGAVGWLP